MRHAIEDLLKEHLEENLREYVTACRAVPNYRGDIEWTGEYSKAHRTA